MKEDLKKTINKYIPYALPLFIIIFASIIYIRSLNSAKEEIVTYKTQDGQDIYFYINEWRFDYTSQITVSSENEFIKLTTGDYEHAFDTEPIYFKKEPRVLFPNQMSLVMTKNSYIQKKLSKFTRLYYKGSFYLENKGLDYPINNAFLYDGNDLYFFLNDTTIKVGDNEEYVIPSFSYVIYNYNNELFIYDYLKDEMIYKKNVSSNVLAINDDYQINLVSDSLVYENGQKLLMKNFEYIPLLKQND